MATVLDRTPVMFKLAAMVRDEIIKTNPNTSIQEITKKAIKLFDDNIKKYTEEYNKLKAARVPKTKKNK